MTEKEFRRLSKGDLIEIIYELKKSEEELKQKLQEAEEKLASREIKKDNAGSIAEASISINGVFEAAQKAADEYLQEISEKKTESDAACERKIAETEAICQKREEECAHRVAEAIRQEARTWDDFQKKAMEFINQREELSILLKNRPQ